MFVGALLALRTLVNSNVMSLTSHSKIKFWEGLKFTNFPFAAWAIAFGMSKLNPSQNQELSTSLERSYKELLNALNNFEGSHLVSTTTYNINVYTVQIIHCMSFYTKLMNN